MVTPIELAVLALAAYRGTQLVVHDTIADPARDALARWHSRRPHSRPRTALITLISCIYCSGWWVSGILLALYLTVTGTLTTAPALVHLIEWAAVAGAAVLLNRADYTLKDRG